MANKAGCSTRGEFYLLTFLVFTYYYIDDLLKRVFSENIGCRLGVNKFSVLTYADDIVLIFPSAGGLRTLLNVFADSVAAHKLALNLNKTNFMVFKNKRQKISEDIPFYVAGKMLESSHF